MEVYSNPTENERKYLTPFQVGSSKITLYGQPIIMSQKSELMKSLLPRLSPSEPNQIAANEKIDQKVLTFLWEYLNGVDKSFNELSIKELFELWPLLNYFDINVEDKLITQYLEQINNNLSNIIDIHEAEYKLLPEILQKVKLIKPVTFEQITYNIAQHKKKKRVKRLLSMGAGNVDYGDVDPEDMDNDLRSIGARILDDDKKIVMIKGSYGASKGKYKLYSYPEFDKDLNAYVMRPVESPKVPLVLKRVGTGGLDENVSVINDADIDGSLWARGWDVVGDFDDKSVRVPVGNMRYKYYTYPEWDKTRQAYVMLLKHD